MSDVCVCCGLAPCAHNPVHAESERRITVSLRAYEEHQQRIEKLEQQNSRLEAENSKLEAALLEEQQKNKALGEQLEVSRTQVKVMRDRLTWIYEQLVPGVGWDSEMCRGVYETVRETLAKVAEMDK